MLKENPYEEARELLMGEVWTEEEAKELIHLVNCRVLPLKKTVIITPDMSVKDICEKLLNLKPEDKVKYIP